MARPRPPRSRRRRAAPARPAARPGRAPEARELPDAALKAGVPAEAHGLRGTPLSEAQVQEGRVSLEHWDPRLLYRWDAGVAISRFLEGLRAGRLLGVRCDRCGRTVTPPRAFCEWCFRPMDAWVELPDTGTVNTFSICTITWDLRRLEVPQVPAVIEIDGTQPRVGFLHLLGDLGSTTVEGILQRVRVGARVRAVWRPAEERTGAITDIRHFALVA